ncbi:hypothetical protein D3C83_249430 [compost metagenome]
MLSRRFPPFEEVSTRISTSFGSGLNALSARLKPQFPFIVMQLSQSTPGMPRSGIFCSGVPKSP